MTDRSKSVIEVTLEARQADALLDRLQQKADRLASSLKGVSVGAGEGGGSAGSTSRAMQAASQTIQTALAETMASGTEALVDSNESLTSALGSLDAIVGDLWYEMRQARTKDDQDGGDGRRKRRGVFGTGISGAAVAGAGALTAVGGGLGSSPGQVLGGIAGVVSGITTGIAEVFDKIPGVPGLIKGLGGLAAAGIGAMGMFAQHRFGIAQQLGGFERAGMWAPLSGTGYGTHSGVPFGMSPVEAASQASAASMAAGVSRSMQGVPLFTLMQSGVSAGAIGGLAGTAAAYGSYRPDPFGPLSTARGGQAQMLRAVFSAGLKDGLRGSRLEGVLSQLSGAIEAAGAGGALIDMQATGNLTANMAAAVRGRTGKGGAFRAMAGLTQAPMSARQSLLAPFAQAQEGLMLAHAARGGGSLVDIIGRLETMGPAGALEALNAAPGVGEMIMGGYGLSIGTGAARSALGAGTGSPGDMGLPGLVSAGPVAQELARTSANQLRSMTQKEALGMIKAMNSLQQALNDLAVKWDFAGKSNKIIGFLDIIIRILNQKL